MSARYAVLAASALGSLQWQLTSTVVLNFALLWVPIAVVVGSIGESVSHKASIAVATLLTLILLRLPAILARVLTIEGPGSTYAPIPHAVRVLASPVHRLNIVIQLAACLALVTFAAMVLPGADIYEGTPLARGYRALGAADSSTTSAAATSWLSSPLGAIAPSWRDLLSLDAAGEAFGLTVPCEVETRRMRAVATALTAGSRVVGDALAARLVVDASGNDNSTAGPWWAPAAALLLRAVPTSSDAASSTPSLLYSLASDLDDSLAAYIVKRPGPFSPLPTLEAAGAAPSPLGALSSLPVDERQCWQTSGVYAYLCVGLTVLQALLRWYWGHGNRLLNPPSDWAVVRRSAGAGRGPVTTTGTGNDGDVDEDDLGEESAAAAAAALAAQGSAGAGASSGGAGAGGIDGGTLFTDTTPYRLAAQLRGNARLWATVPLMARGVVVDALRAAFLLAPAIMIGWEVAAVVLRVAAALASTALAAAFKSHVAPAAVAAGGSAWALLPGIAQNALATVGDVFSPFLLAANVAVSLAGVVLRGAWALAMFVLPPSLAWTPFPASAASAAAGAAATGAAVDGGFSLAAVWAAAPLPPVSLLVAWFIHVVASVLDSAPYALAACLICAAMQAWERAVVTVDLTRRATTIGEVLTRLMLLGPLASAITPVPSSSSTLADVADASAPGGSGADTVKSTLLMDRSTAPIFRRGDGATGSASVGTTTAASGPTQAVVDLGALPASSVEGTQIVAGASGGAGSDGGVFSTAAAGNAGAGSGSAGRSLVVDALDMRIAAMALVPHDTLTAYMLTFPIGNGPAPTATVTGGGYASSSATGTTAGPVTYTTSSSFAGARAGPSDPFMAWSSGPSGVTNMPAGLGSPVAPYFTGAGASSAATGPVAAESAGFPSQAANPLTPGNRRLAVRRTAGSLAGGAVTPAAAAAAAAGARGLLSPGATAGVPSSSSSSSIYLPQSAQYLASVAAATGGNPAAAASAVPGTVSGAFISSYAPHNVSGGGSGVGMVAYARPPWMLVPRFLAARNKVLRVGGTAAGGGGDPDPDDMDDATRAAYGLPPLSLYKRTAKSIAPALVPPLRLLLRLLGYRFVSEPLAGALVQPGTSAAALIDGSATAILPSAASGAAGGAGASIEELPAQVAMLLGSADSPLASTWEAAISFLTGTVSDPALRLPTPLTAITAFVAAMRGVPLSVVGPAPRMALAPSIRSPLLAQQQAALSQWQLRMMSAEFALYRGDAVLHHGTPGVPPNDRQGEGAEHGVGFRLDASTASVGETLAALAAGIWGTPGPRSLRFAHLLAGLTRAGHTLGSIQDAPTGGAAGAAGNGGAASRGGATTALPPLSPPVLAAITLSPMAPFLRLFRDALLSPLSPDAAQRDGPAAPADAYPHGLLQAVHRGGAGAAAAREGDVDAAAAAGGASLWRGLLVRATNAVGLGALAGLLGGGGGDMHLSGSVSRDFIATARTQTAALAQLGRSVGAGSVAAGAGIAATRLRLLKARLVTLSSAAKRSYGSLSFRSFVSTMGSVASALLLPPHIVNGARVIWRRPRAAGLALRVLTSGSPGAVPVREAHGAAPLYAAAFRAASAAPALLRPLLALTDAWMLSALRYWRRVLCEAGLVQPAPLVVQAVQVAVQGVPQQQLLMHEYEEDEDAVPAALVDPLASPSVTTPGMTPGGSLRRRRVRSQSPHPGAAGRATPGADIMASPSSEAAAPTLAIAGGATLTGSGSSAVVDAFCLTTPGAARPYSRSLTPAASAVAASAALGCSRTSSAAADLLLPPGDDVPAAVNAASGLTQAELGRIFSDVTGSVWAGVLWPATALVDSTTLALHTSALSSRAPAAIPAAFAALEAENKAANAAKYAAPPKPPAAVPGQPQPQPVRADIFRAAPLPVANSAAMPGPLGQLGAAGQPLVPVPAPVAAALKATKPYTSPAMTVISRALAIFPPFIEAFRQAISIVVGEPYAAAKAQYEVYYTMWAGLIDATERAVNRQLRPYNPTLDICPYAISNNDQKVLQLAAYGTHQHYDVAQAALKASRAAEVSLWDIVGATQVPKERAAAAVARIRNALWPAPSVAALAVDAAAGGSLLRDMRKQRTATRNAAEENGAMLTAVSRAKTDVALQSPPVDLAALEEEQAAQAAIAADQQVLASAGLQQPSGQQALPAFVDKATRRRMYVAPRNAVYARNIALFAVGLPCLLVAWSVAGRPTTGAAVPSALHGVDAAAPVTSVPEGSWGGSGVSAQWTWDFAATDMGDVPGAGVVPSVHRTHASRLVLGAFGRGLQVDVPVAYLDDPAAARMEEVARAQQQPARRQVVRDASGVYRTVTIPQPSPPPLPPAPAGQQPQVPITLPYLTAVYWLVVLGLELTAVNLFATGGLAAVAAVTVVAYAALMAGFAASYRVDVAHMDDQSLVVEIADAVVASQLPPLAVFGRIRPDVQAPYLLRLIYFLRHALVSGVRVALATALLAATLAVTLVVTAARRTGTLAREALLLDYLPLAVQLVPAAVRLWAWSSLASARVSLALAWVAVKATCAAVLRLLRGAGRAAVSTCTSQPRRLRHIDASVAAATAVNEQRVQTASNDVAAAAGSVPGGRPGEAYVSACVAVGRHLGALAAAATAAADEVDAGAATARDMVRSHLSLLRAVCGRPDVELCTAMAQRSRAVGDVAATVASAASGAATNLMYGLLSDVNDARLRDEDRGVAWAAEELAAAARGAEAVLTGLRRLVLPLKRLRAGAKSAAASAAEAADLARARATEGAMPNAIDDVTADARAAVSTAAEKSAEVAGAEESLCAPAAGVGAIATAEGVVAAAKVCWVGTRLSPLEPLGPLKPHSLSLHLLARSPSDVTASVLADYRATLAAIDLVATAVVASVSLDRAGIVHTTLPAVVASLAACLAALGTYLSSPRYLSAPAFLTAGYAQQFLSGDAWDGRAEETNAALMGIVAGGAGDAAAGAASTMPAAVRAGLATGAHNVAMLAHEGVSGSVVPVAPHARPASAALQAGLISALTRIHRAMPAYYGEVARQLPSPVLVAVALQAPLS